MMSVLLVLRFSCSDLGWKLVCHVEQKFGKRDKVFNVLLSGRLFAFMKKSIRIFAETISSIGQSLGDHSRLSKVLNLLLEITFVRTRGQPLSLRSVGPFLTSSFANSVLLSHDTTTSSVLRAARRPSGNGWHGGSRQIHQDRTPS